MFTLPRNGDQTDLDTVLEVVQVAHLDDPVLNDVRYEDGGVVRGDDVLVA